MRRKWFALFGAILVGSVIGQGCSCNDNKAEDLTCPDALEGPYDSDLFDASNYPATQTAFARVITDANDLIGGPYAQGKVGDILIYNDKIRVIIEGPGDPIAALGQFGGNIIDADIVRPAADPGQDRFGELIPIIHLGKTMFPDTVTIVRDGSDNGPVVVKVCGDDETIDFFNLKALASDFGVNVAYDVTVPYNLRMSHTYVLAPGSDRVHIASTVGNKNKSDFHTPVGDVIHTGATRETFTTNRRGWGEGGISGLLNAHPPTRIQAFPSPEVGYGLIPSDAPNIALDVSGVNALAYGFESAFSVFGSSPTPGAAGIQTVKAGRRYSWHRTFVVTAGGGAGPFSDVYYDLFDVPDTVVRTGTVTEDDNTTPIAGARVTVLDTTNFPLTSFETAADGSFGGALPAGTYRLVADVVGRGAPTYSAGNATTITTIEDGNDLPGVEITLDASATALPNVTFPQPSYLQVSVTDITGVGTGNGTPVPAKIVLTGADPTPQDSLFRDTRKDDLPSTMFRVTFAGANGQAMIPVEPGTFDVVITRGNEYSMFTEQIVVGAGQTVLVNGGGGTVELDRVIDTSDWISVDSHIHMQNSPDSRVAPPDRVLSAVAENLEVLVNTDHDFVSDISGEIATLGLGAFVAPVIGDEITTWDYGHFNAFPLTRDDTSPSGGAHDWMSGRGAINNQTADQIFTAVEAAYTGTQVLQVNHPRGGSTFQSYFDSIGLDTVDLTTKTPAAERRIPDQAGATVDDTKLFSQSFTAMEVRNGAGMDPDREVALLNDWFTFLSHGLPVAGLGVSDSHSELKDQLGWGRTYVYMGAGGDVPATLDREAMAVAINNNQIVSSMGPFLNVTLDNGGTPVLPGQTLLNAAGTLNLTIGAEAPDWIPIDTIEIFANTADTVTAEGGNETSPVTVCTLTAGVDFDVSTLLSPVNNTPYFSVEALGGGNPLVVDISAGACDIAGAVAAGASGDAWLVVRVSDSVTTNNLFPMVHDTTQRGEAVTGAFFIDRSNDASYVAPGIVTTTSVTRNPADPPQLRRIGDGMTAGDLEDVRSVFDYINEGHDH